MDSMSEITDAHVGNPVVNKSGQEVAIIRDVKNGAAFVEPMPDLGAGLRTELGWSSDDQELYRLDESHIDAVRSGSVRITDPR
jgi:hypothetical protein